MRNYLFLLFILFSSLCHAQIAPVQGVSLNPIDQSIFSQWASEVDSETSNVDVEGSPFLFNDWVKGELTTIKGDHHTDIDLKLDLFSDQLIYKNPFTRDSTLIMSEFLTSFKLQDKDTAFAFHYVPASAEKTRKVRAEDFYLVLLDGQTTLLARPEVKIKRATKNSLVNGDGQLKDRFSRSSEFYLRSEDGQVKKVKSSRKSFAKALPKYQDHVLKHLKENKSDLNDPQDLIAVVSYYNSLN